MADRWQMKRGTAAAWADANRVLADGEPGYESDTGKLKIGNGVAPWTVLPYASEGPQGPPGPALVEDPADPGFYISGA